jgi:serine/threonine protein kinase
MQCLAAIDGAELDLSSPAWQAAAPEARELVTVMLARDPACRPSAQQLLDKYGSWLAIGDPQKEAEPLEQ